MAGTDISLKIYTILVVLTSSLISWCRPCFHDVVYLVITSMLWWRHPWCQDVLHVVVIYFVAIMFSMPQCCPVVLMSWMSLTHNWVSWNLANHKFSGNIWWTQGKLKYVIYICKFGRNVKWVWVWCVFQQTFIHIMAVIKTEMRYRIRYLPWPPKKCQKLRKYIHCEKDKYLSSAYMIHVIRSQPRSVVSFSQAYGWLPMEDCFTLQ